MNRRSFLSRTVSLGGSLTTFPYATSFLGQLVHGMIQQARADETGAAAETRYYVNVHISGGPARLSFDQWIRTTPGESIVGNPYVSTAYTSANGQINGLEYVTTNYNGVEVPYLFSTQGFNGAGGRRNLSDILGNMLVVRGFGTNFDGHDTNTILVYSPVTGLPNLPGLIADSNSKLFSGVGGNLVSMKNKAATHYSEITYLQSLFGAFQKNELNMRSASLKEINQSTYDVAMSFLKSYARSDRIGARTIASNMDNASRKMRQGLGDIDSYWPAAAQRYQNAVNATAQQIGVPRISDMPIIRKGSGIPDGFFSVFGFIPAGQMDFMPGAEWDLREMVQTMTMFGLAEKLAMTEYLIKGDYTPSVNLGIVNFNNVSMKTDPANDPIRDPYVNKQQLYFSHTDMDSSTGAVSNLLLTHNYYSAVVAGILELKEQLGNANKLGSSQRLWGETVVHLTSEFARNCLNNGVITPHGYNHMVSSAFSGAIQNGPYVVGNIIRDVPGLGTNGLMAPVGAGYPVAKAPSPVMMTSTIAELLRASHNPWANTAPPLISLNQTSGIISYPFGKGKIVDG